MHRFEDLYSEIDAMPDSPYLASYRAFFELRNTSDYGQWLAALKSLRAGLDESEDALGAFWRIENGLWTAYIINRDYPGATQLFDEYELAKIEEGRHLMPEIRQEIYTYWLMGEKTLLVKFTGYARAHAELDLSEAGEFGSHVHYLIMALVNAAEGRGEEVIRLLRRWEQETDPSGLHLFKEETCRMLAMVGETAAAVQCIRDGLRMPSLTIPFIEPHLPFYDSIRETPEFVELLAEIEASINAEVH